jgi:hypothetical protein
LETSAGSVCALASNPESLNLGAMSEQAFDRLPTAVPLDRKTLLARFDGIRQFARGGRRAPNKPLLLLYALARLEHDRPGRDQIQRDRGCPAAPPARLRALGRQRAYLVPLRRLGNDGLWLLPDRAQLVDAKGNVREEVARERDAPADFIPDVLATTGNRSCVKPSESSNTRPAIPP